MVVVAAIKDMLDRVGEALIAPEQDAEWAERVESRIDAPPSYMRSRLL